jgi:antagonist of KipI
MPVIEVRAPGLLTTVQDLGRDAFGPLGVSPSGAADPVSLRIGNRLVGNSESAAALEMTLLGGTFLFPGGAIIALAGSDFGATLDEASVDPWRSLAVHANQTLRFGATRSGARCYLCVQGGISVDPFLGSASTHLLSGLGGFHGRPLKKGDVLRLGVPAKDAPKQSLSTRTFTERRLSASALDRLAPRKVLRVTPGPQSDLFSAKSRKLFLSSPYRVTEESNRMGLRLEGPALTPPSGQMITEGVSLGAVQITAAGLPIILFVEQQTTGGYPKIANVISADLASVGQLRPRDEIRFELVDWKTARSLLIEQEELLASKKLLVP